MTKPLASRVAACLFLALSLSGCIRPGSSLSVVAASSDLAGAWRLVEYVAWDSAGEPKHLFGPSPSGYAAFDARGVAFIQIMRPNDAGSFAAFYGSFLVNPAGDTLRIRVEGSNIPEYLQSVQVRPFRIRADTLVLGLTGQYRATLVKVPNP